MPALAAHEGRALASLGSVAALVLSSRCPLATTFAALGARHPDGGACRPAARRAFGASRHRHRLVLLRLDRSGLPAARLRRGTYVADDSLGGGRQTQLVTSGLLIVAVAVMNWFGIRVSGRVRLVIAGTLACSCWSPRWCRSCTRERANLTPSPRGWAAIGGNGPLLIWAFAGWEVDDLAELEYRDPARDIGRATVGADRDGRDVPGVACRDRHGAR